MNRSEADAAGITKTRVAIVFSGGPAPAANAVIASAASALMRAGFEVLGILHGYSALQDYDAATRPLVEGEDYRVITPAELRGLRNSRGICIGTARANPGRQVNHPDHLLDCDRTPVDRQYQCSQKQCQPGLYQA